MISNIHTNIMGTVSFDGKFQGMRKPQDFIVYPMQNEGQSNAARIQSDNRAGFIRLEDGAVFIATGQYNFGQAKAQINSTLTAEELFNFKAAIFATASGKAGTNGVVYCDNSAAIDVFAV